MKIIETAKDIANKKEARDIANMGCNRCPCCGETNSDLYYIKQNIFNKGIVSGCCRHWATGLFKTKYMQVDSYSCLTCGAKWESDPYEY